MGLVKRYASKYREGPELLPVASCCDEFVPGFVSEMRLRVGKGGDVPARAGHRWALGWRAVWTAPMRSISRQNVSACPSGGAPT